MCTATVLVRSQVSRGEGHASLLSCVLPSLATYLLPLRINVGIFYYCVFKSLGLMSLENAGTHVFKTE